METGNQENDSEANAAIQRRLKRLEGQIQGLQRMIEDQRDSLEVFHQFLAVRAAIDEAAALYLEQEITQCLLNPEPQKEHIAMLLRSCLRC